MPAGQGGPLLLVDDWDVPNVAAAVVRADGTVAATHGDQLHRFRLASISKLLSAYAVMIAVEEEAVSLDDPAGPDGATLRHLLAHASGLGFDAGDPTQPVLNRRVYSNAGIEAAADHLTLHTGIPFAQYLSEAVFAPLGMTSSVLEGSPAHQVFSTVADLVAFVREVFAPALLAPQTVAEMTAVQYPGLTGVVPGVGRFDPCDWGLGFERNFGRPKHWAGQSVSTQAFGHFGGAGTFTWWDPAAAVACICLTDRPFDTWALEVWPPLSDAVVRTYGRSAA